MLDENFPSYHFQKSANDPLQNILFFTHNGSDPTPEYLIKRPPPASSRNQYALALFDAHYSSVIYGEVLVKPEWSQPTLSAAEIHSSAQNGQGVAATPITPDSFSVLLYNPDQSIAVKKLQGGLARPDYWAFEIPERTFKLPSASQLDREAPNGHMSELSPKIVFHWKRDGRLSRDLTCYMAGKSVGGKKSKEPDITIAMFRAGKNGGVVSIYEPNMARVEVEDRKGLEVVLLLSAVVVRDLYVSPRQDAYNAAAGPGPVANRAQHGAQPNGSGGNKTTMYGALEDKQSNIDAETKRLRAMVDEEERRRERLNREEEGKTRRMLQQEEEMRRRRQAEVEKETERLRRQYGVPIPNQHSNNSSLSPPLPQRRPVSMVPSMSGALGPLPTRQPSASGRFYGPPCGSAVSPPARPYSTGPQLMVHQASSPPEPGRRPFGNALGLLKPKQPGGNLRAAASVSNLIAGNRDEEQKMMNKKQSVLF